MTTTSTINVLLASVMREIAQAAGKGDLGTITVQTRKAAELEEMRKTVMSIEEKLTGLQTQPSQEVATLRELPVEVSEGMLNQNLLTLTQHVKRGRIKVGEDLIVELQPSGERFRTELLRNGNKLQERGAIGRFYRETGVIAGDFVVLSEISSNRWVLKKAAVGQYKSRHTLLAEL